MPAPPEAVLVAFGATARPEPFAGGQGLAWRAGDVVLKPLDMSFEALRWQFDVLGSLVCDDLRVAAPLATRTGELVVDGWTAWPYLAGAHLPRWADILAVGHRSGGQRSTPRRSWRSTRCSGTARTSGFSKRPQGRSSSSARSSSACARRWIRWAQRRAIAPRSRSWRERGSEAARGGAAGPDSPRRMRRPDAATVAPSARACRSARPGHRGGAAHVRRDRNRAPSAVRPFCASPRALHNTSSGREIDCPA